MNLNNERGVKYQASIIEMSSSSSSSSIFPPSRGRDKNPNLRSSCSNLQEAKSQIEEGKREIKRSPELDLLKRVLLEDLKNDFRDDNKLVFAAIHSIFLESGFVAFDPVSGSRIISLYDILKSQNSNSTFTNPISYTLPQILSGGDNDRESIVLKFYTIGRYVSVYGHLAKTSTHDYSEVDILKIDKSKYVPSIRSFRIKNILELWKFVKDCLVLPLWINLCEKTGLDLPTCLISLPTELQLRILGLLPSDDIVTLAFVCKDLKNLCSNDELWKEKYMSQFGSGTAAGGGVLPVGSNWKLEFCSSWEKTKKKMKTNMKAYTRTSFQIVERFGLFGNELFSVWRGSM